MKKKRISLAVGAALITSSSTLWAAPFNSFDPRSMAMGGAGVAVANTATAPFFNPSLLAVTRDDDDFAMELPIIGVRAHDPDDFVDSVDDFEEAEYDVRLNNSVDTISTNIDSSTINSSDYTDAANATADLNSGLKNLDNKPIQMEAGVATVIGIPSKKFGMALTASGTATVAGVVNYNDEDFLSGVESDLAAMSECLETQTIDNCDYSQLTYIDSSTGNEGRIINENGDAFDAENDVKSTVDVRALTLQEIGFSFAREVNMGGMNFAAGITPKYVKATVYDYEAKATDEDADDNEDDYSKEYSHFNLDLGVAKNYANGWRTGFVIKNLIAQEYDTYRRNSNTGEMEKTGNRIELKPQARIGVSHTSDWHTVALDVDLTENEPVGFEEGSRFVALGGELNLADWAQLRAGYRVNTVDSDRSIASVGLGLSPFGVHFDVAVAGNDNEMGAAAQFGFRF